MKTRFSILNSLVIMTVAIGMSAALNRVHAADATGPSWFAKTQQRLASAVDTKVAGIAEAATAKAIPTLLEAARVVATTRARGHASTLLR